MNQTLLDRWSTASVEDVRAMPQEQYENIFDYFEDRNAHTENLVLQAKRFGTPDEIETAEIIRTAQRRAGGLDRELFDRARKLRRRLDAKTTPPKGRTMEEKTNSQEYWAWLDNGDLHPLGVCGSFDEASEKTEIIERDCLWIFSRESMEDMQAKINEQIRN